MFSRTNIRDEVYDFLLAQILQGKYPPGHHFDLTELETDLGISRTPLKEALQRLETIGIVEIQPRRGTYVTQIDAERVIQNYQVRHALELYAVKTALPGISDSRIKGISKLNEAMRKIKDQGDLEAGLAPYLKLDHQFHGAIVSLASNERMNQIYDQINIHMQLTRVRRHYMAAHWQESQAEHDAIQDALERRDRDALSVAIDVHISRSVGRFRWGLDRQNHPED